MQRSDRFQLERGGRVIAFSHAHPDGSAGAVEDLARLEELLSRGTTLATQQQTGTTTVRVAAVSKRRMRAEINRTPLRHLVRIAVAASAQQPELRARFRMPASGISFQEFLAEARALAEEATTHRELFLSYGLPEKFLEDLAAALDQLEAAIDSKTSGLAAKTGAVADLQVVTREMGKVVAKIDARNRIRFQDQPELLQAWQSIKLLPTHATQAAEPAPAPAPADRPAA